MGDVQVGLPTDRSQYIHRVGRTARAGKQVRPRRSGLDRIIAQPGLLWWQSRLLAGSLGLLRASTRHLAAASGMESCPPPLWGRGGAAVLTGTRRRAQGKGVLLLCDYESPSFMRQLRDVRVQTAPVVPQEAATAIQPHIARGLQVTPPTQLLGCRRRCALLDSMGDRCYLLVHIITRLQTPPFAAPWVQTSLSARWLLGRPPLPVIVSPPPAGAPCSPKPVLQGQARVCICCSPRDWHAIHPHSDPFYLQVLL